MDSPLLAAAQGAPPTGTAAAPTIQPGQSGLEMVRAQIQQRLNDQQQQLAGSQAQSQGVLQRLMNPTSAVSPELREQAARAAAASAMSGQGSFGSSMAAANSTYLQAKLAEQQAQDALRHQNDQILGPILKNEDRYTQQGINAGLADLTRLSTAGSVNGASRYKVVGGNLVDTQGANGPEVVQSTAPALSSETKESLAQGLATNKLTTSSPLFGKLSPDSQAAIIQRATEINPRFTAHQGSYGLNNLTPEQNTALFGPQGAVTTGRLDPNRLNSRTAGIMADAFIMNPNTDFSKISADISLSRNSGFRQKAMTAEVLPEIMQNVVDAGKKVGFSDNRTIGKMQAWVKGEFNDPDMTEYMTLRNDALMSIAGVMRGSGMTDMAHKAETEVAAPSMSPAALDAWMQGQMKSLQPRLNQMHNVMRTPATAPAAAGTSNAAPTPSSVRRFNPTTGKIE